MTTTLLHAIVVSLLSVLLQQPTVPAQSGDGEWPPPGVGRANKDGVVLPRVLREVRPQYTADAMRERIEGKVRLECVVETDGTVQRVRVVGSLDKLYGLDEQAINAAKQWRFTPGTKDNVAIPVLITLDLTFVMRPAAPTPITWPEAFVSRGSEVVDTTGWTEDVADVSGLHLRVSYPKEWALKKGGANGRMFYLQSAGGRGTHIFFVENPKPTRVQIGANVTADMLQRLADLSRQQTTTPAGRPDLKGVGLARYGDRFWIWHDLALSQPDPATLPPAVSALVQTIDGSHMWTFTTTQGQQEISTGCVVLYPRDMPDAAKQQDDQRAGAEFAAILKRVLIQPQ